MDGDGDVGWSRKRDVTEWRNRDGQEQSWLMRREMGRKDSMG